MSGMITIILLSSLLNVSNSLFNLIGRDQYVTVTGTLICNDQPASDVLVKLYEDGTIFDTKLDSSRSNYGGQFQVSGTYTKIFTMDPKINIYHKCNYDGFCDRKLTIDIPDNAITDGSSGWDRSFDIGTINLADKFHGETTDCIH
ncbi:unnamed protein product [Caenorhabditis angaria]|uniref:Uncharacterized protein n=1 Tax=Caenorhabditis angaria TaxID=860376 RepID=A0A9P1IXB0_9PELO|nr:unnamed protein product [Caenorhabditis angaria]